MRFDFLVIGSGVAGLWFALHAAQHGTVGIITKRRLDDSASGVAQGGIAAVIDPLDSIDAHERDTIVAGAGLCDPDIVRLIVDSAPREIHQLIELGTRFSTDTANAHSLSLGREGGHSTRRIVHAADMTGAELIRALTAAVDREPAITVLDRHFAIDLLDPSAASAGARPTTTTPVASPARCMGAFVLDETTKVARPIHASATVLATGGLGQVFRHTSNPPVATGDGVAMAFRAGCGVRNLEFVQFHPTYFHGPPTATKGFLITEAMRGEGAILRNADGDAFMKRRHDMADLAPRDVVARAMAEEMRKAQASHLFLDVTHLPAEHITARFPTIHRLCLDAGVDMTREPIPVAPAAHYSCGGVRVGNCGETDRLGLYAVGETACTGFHGANRLASNSLLEALVISRRAARHAADYVAKMAATNPVTVASPSFSPARAPGDGDYRRADLTASIEAVREAMSRWAGIVRTTRDLMQAHHSIAAVSAQLPRFFRHYGMDSRVFELRNLVLVADLIVTSALSRRESRGCHFMRDFPLPNPLPLPTDLLAPSGFTTDASDSPLRLAGRAARTGDVRESVGLRM